MLSEHLHWLHGHTAAGERLYVGRFVWHSWQVLPMEPKMFSFGYEPAEPWEAVPVFVALGTVAFFYNFVALAFIQATSALAIMVAGNLKHVLLIVLPMVMHHESDPNRSYSAYHWLVRGHPAAAAKRCLPAMHALVSPYSDRAS